MAYEGELLTYCPVQMFDFSNAYVVVVSGDGINRWGHMLLNTGGPQGNYFQVVAGSGLGAVYATPRYMDAAGYQRYLRETGKKELNRYSVTIPRPASSEAELEWILSRPRWWLGAWHNCEEMVEDIIVAGGGPHIHSGSMYLPTESAIQPR